MMKRKMLFVLFSISLGASGAFAQTQTRTITNADLEKFREQRMAAEKELRENYRELGFASPEERARQAERAAAERAELAARLREERAQREEIERMTAAESQPPVSDGLIIYPSGGSYYLSNRGGYFYSFGYPNYYRGKRYRRGGYYPYYHRRPFKGSSRFRRGGAGIFFPSATRYLNWRRQQFNRTRDRINNPGRRGDRRGPVRRGRRHR